MNDKFKYSLYTLVLSVFISFIIIPIRLVDMPFAVSTLIGFILYFTSTTYIINKYGLYISVNRILILALIGASCFQVPIRIIYFSSSLGSLPEFLFHILGILIGYIFHKGRSFYRYLFLTISFGLCLFYFFWGWSLWSNKLCYGTFRGNVIEYKVNQNIIFKNEYNQNLNISHIKKKIVILDFWTTKCGVCFRKFPIAQKIYNKYKQNPIICFYSVNSFLKDIDKDGDAFRIIKERGFTFPILICKNIYLLKELNISGYPSVLIFNKEGVLVFRGDIEDADKKIEELLK